MPTSAASVRCWRRKSRSKNSGLAAKGWKIDIVSADHQNKVDIASNIARQWFDKGQADVILDSLNSGVALAVSQIVKEKNKVFLVSGAATSDLSGKSCTPNMIHWTYDTYAMANGTGKALTKAGGDSWFFVTADYAFGKALERDTTAVVVANGGKVLGDVMAPLNNADFSSQLLQAQASKAKVIGLANAGADAANSIKQAGEFGVTQGGQKLAALLIFLSDVHALGLNTAQGLEFTETYYWDMNDQTRAFADRFAKRSKNGAKPDMVPAEVYSSVVHYLKAVEALGATADGAAVVAKMKAMPTEDQAFGKGYIREDGRKIHPAYLLRDQEAGEIEISVGLRPHRRHHPGRGGLPAAGAERMSAGEEVTALAPSPRSRGEGEPTPRIEARNSHIPLLGISTQALFQQLLVGLINGSFYALLSLGLAVIFGMLNIVNFAHGALYMMGAFCAYFLLNVLGIGYWLALILAPLVVGAVRHADRADAAEEPRRTRSPLQPAADLRPGADHPGRVPELVRLLGPALCRSPTRSRAAAISASCTCRIYRALGHRVLRGRLFLDLVPDREDPARRLSARGDREPDAGARLRHQRAAHDHLDLRLRRRRWRRWPACWRRRSIRCAR